MFLLGLRNKRGELTAIIADVATQQAAQRYARNMCQFYPVDCTFVVMPAMAAVKQHPDLCRAYHARCQQQEIRTAQYRLRRLKERYFAKKRQHEDDARRDALEAVLLQLVTA